MSIANVLHLFSNCLAKELDLNLVDKKHVGLALS